MGDPYWLQRQALPQQLGSVKRPRSEFVELPPPGPTAVPETHTHLTREDDRGAPSNPLRDTDSLQSAYDRYLQNSQNTSSEEGSNRFGAVGLGRSVGSDAHALRIREPNPTTARLETYEPEILRNDRDMAFHGPPLPLIERPAMPRETLPLPSDASSTLYIEGLPANCTRREVAHIVRPFVGYKEVRIVKKDSKHRGGEPLILCFVDFADAACAATALSALQGYKMDEQDPDSVHLRLQFSKSPGPKSAPGARPRW